MGRVRSVRFIVLRKPRRNTTLRFGGNLNLEGRMIEKKRREEKNKVEETAFNFGMLEVDAVFNRRPLIFIH